MKRMIISSEYISGMSLPKSKAEKKFESISDTICDHIIKCLVYKNTTNDLNKWIEEIADKLDIINQTTIKIDRSSKKLKSENYEDLVFGGFGDEKSDIRLYLAAFETDYKDYPTFEISDNLIEYIFNTTSNIKTNFSNILSTKNNINYQDWIDRLKYYLA